MIEQSISFKGRAPDLHSGCKGTWCSGITPAQHAGGPGFNPQCAHYSLNRYNLLRGRVIKWQAMSPSQNILAKAGCKHAPTASDTLAERLRRRPAKPTGSPRVGSNPTGVDFAQVPIVVHFTPMILSGWSALSWFALVCWHMHVDASSHVAC